MKEFRSDISGFYKLSMEERRKLLSELVDLNQEEIEILNTLGYFKPNQIDSLIENVVGSYQLPFGLAFNFIVNKKDYIIPMVIEEPSVVAAASNAAKFARKHGGFQSEEVKPVMIAQIQVTQLDHIESAKKSIEENKKKLLKIANEQDPLLNKLGGGAQDIEIREIQTEKGQMIILHLLVKGNHSRKTVCLNLCTTLFQRLLMKTATSKPVIRPVICVPAVAVSG